MPINVKIRNFLPHVLAVIFFIVLSYMYFYPVLEGKILMANDSNVSRYASKEIVDYREQSGREPLWTNAMFSGMPAYLISVKHPGNLVKPLDLALRVFKMPVSVLFLAMTGFYILLLMFGMNRWIAVTGAVAWGFSSFLFLILAAGHNTQAIALVYMAPMIGGVWYAYRRNAIKGALFTAFVLSLELVANHPQITYYAVICLLVFIITEFIRSLREKEIPAFLKTSALLVVPVIIALGINFGNLYTVYEYSKYSMRGKSDLVIETGNQSKGLDRDYITHWSYGIDESMNLLIPNYKGGSSRPFDRDSRTVRALRQNDLASASGQVLKYWGTQPGTDGPHYMGAIVIFLFILGLIITRGPEKWWLLIATVLSLMLAWGKNFMPFTNLFIDFFPGYNKFRAVTMTLVIAQFCIPLLAALALRDVFESRVTGKDLMKGLKIASGISAGILLLVIIFPGIAGSFLNEGEAPYPEWLRTAMIADRKELLRTDAIRSLAFILAAAAIVLAFVKDKLRKEHSVILIGMLILLDLWNIDKRYLDAGRFEKPSSFQKSVTPSAADAFILNDGSYYRVLNLAVSTFNDNTPTSYFHKSIGGYHGAKLKRYQELIDSAIIRDLIIFTESARDATSADDLVTALAGTPSLNMLNTKYIIYNPEAPPVINPYHSGNAWFVENPVMAANANEEIGAIKNLDPSDRAIIDKQFADLVPAAAYPLSDGDTISLVSYKPDELVYSYSAADEKLVVFSEIYYPAGWKCYVDGTETPYFRANYVLRAMVAPPGEHEIRFSFEPASYITGNRVSLAASVLLILLTAGYFASGFVMKPKSGSVNGSSQ
ncbi:MAG TPA: hypothetical protein PLO24_08330 [Bacteroidales bacterium]|jgi:hypothetical protein|nr:hypothetical protein [Bacteroidales bacterium]HOS72281.1 hypothetical protein [Bacteroidales bacterium]HQH24390.1 hypothetical protein [Bacteroidales bacterium]HQJ81477.1 hypothetical protein [Bacteroidales bacterium]